MERLSRIKSFLEENYKADTAHDLSHIERVYKLSEEIQQEEDKGDLFLVRVIALLHDFLDHKFYLSNKRDKLIKFLKSEKFTKQEIEYILNDIDNISYKTGDTSLLSIEGKIVQDADRIDAIGAVGIARAFLYGGDNSSTIEEVIQHFNEKLLLIADNLNTKAATDITLGRHKYMEGFLDQLAMELGKKR